MRAQDYTHSTDFSGGALLGVQADGSVKRVTPQVFAPNIIIKPDGFETDETRQIDEAFGDNVNLSQFLKDPEDATKCFSQLMKAIDRAYGLGRPLFATRAFPTIPLNSNTIAIPDGLNFTRFGKPLVFQNTTYSAITGTGLKNVTLKGLHFNGVHVGSGNNGGYNVFFTDCEDLDLDVSIKNGNSGVRLENCKRSKVRLRANEMTGTGLRVSGFDTDDIDVWFEGRNLDGFGVYGNDGAKNVRVRRLIKDFRPELINTPELLAQVVTHIVKWRGIADYDEIPHLGLEGLGITYSCDRWTVHDPLIIATGDNGISITGTNTVIYNPRIIDCKQDAIHFYGGGNRVYGGFARRCGRLSSTNGAAINGYAAASSGNSGGVPWNNVVDGFRDENCLRGSWHAGGTTYQPQWVSGGPGNSQIYCYWDGPDGLSFVFRNATNGGVTGNYGTVDPTTASWTYDPALRPDQQAQWNDGVIAWNMLNAFPTGRGPYASDCKWINCLSTQTVEAKIYVNEAPTGNNSYVPFVGSAGDKIVNGVNSAAVTSTGALELDVTGLNSGNVPTLMGKRSASSGGSPVDVTASSILLQLKGSGRLSGGFAEAGVFRIIVGAINSGVLRPTYQFFSKLTAGTQWESFRINEAGRVAIGKAGTENTNPLYSLDVMGPAGADFFTTRAEQAVTSITGAALALTSGHVGLNLAAPGTITTLTCAEAGEVHVNLRNDTANAVTFTHASTGIRLNTGADVVLGQYQSITLRRIGSTGSVWQQI